MKKVIVLMSTYNGEKYIEEQIASVLDQFGVSVELWVRDDGSTDKTLDILKEYENEGKISLIEGRNVGFRESFMLLVRAAADADYYAFCDQDDVWKQEKLFVMTKALEPLKEQPAIAISDLQMVDADLHPVRQTRSSFRINYERVDKEQLKKLVSIENVLAGYGCTQVWNEALHKLVLDNKGDTKCSHDYILGIIGIMCGHFIVVNEKMIYYRQHNLNTSGSRIGIRKLKTVITQHIETISGRRQDSISSVDKNIIDCYGHIMEEKSLEILTNVANYKTSINNRWSLLRSDYCNGLEISDIVKTKMKILLGVL